SLYSARPRRPCRSQKSKGEPPMSKSILIHENGGPEKMQLADVDIGDPGPGQVKVRHTAIGLNFIDIYTRSGLYQTPMPNAAGGVGLLFGQWAKARGYKVIGTVSSAEKATLAKKNGYKWVINYTKEDVVARVKEITKGKGVPAVFDGVGKDTWNASLDCLQPRGIMVSFGNASGAVPPQPLGVLNTKGSLYVTRPSLGAYNATRKELEASAKTLFKMVKSRKVKIAIDQRYPLAEAAQAHIDL